MELFARFELAGVITKKKSMTSKTNKEWKGQMLEVSSLGEKLDIFVSDDIFAAVGEGEHLLFKGPLHGQERGVKLVISSIQNVNTKEWVWPRKSPALAAPAAPAAAAPAGGAAPAPASMQSGKVA